MTIKVYSVNGFLVSREASRLVEICTPTLKELPIGQRNHFIITAACYQISSGSYSQNRTLMNCNVGMMAGVMVDNIRRRILFLPFVVAFAIASPHL